MKPISSATKVLATLAFVLYAYLIGSSIDQQREEQDGAARKHQAARIAEAYRSGVNDGADAERERERIEREARHE